MLYIENYSFWLDIKILLMTFKVILQKENSEGTDQLSMLGWHVSQPNQPRTRKSARTGKNTIR